MLKRAGEKLDDDNQAPSKHVITTKTMHSSFYPRAWFFLEGVIVGQFRPAVPTAMIATVKSAES